MYISRLLSIRSRTKSLDGGKSAASSFSAFVSVGVKGTIFWRTLGTLSNVGSSSTLYVTRGFLDKEDDLEDKDSVEDDFDATDEFALLSDLFEIIDDDDVLALVDFVSYGEYLSEAFDDDFSVPVPWSALFTDDDVFDVPFTFSLFFAIVVLALSVDML